MKPGVIRKILILLLIISVTFIFAQEGENSDGWASSLHLTFQDDQNKKADLLMTDVMIDSSSQSTYYAFINFSGGYCGFQDHGSYHTAHFSLWDYVDGDEQEVPPEKRARIVWCGYHVDGSGFGNEGTGVKTSRKYAWKKNQPYRVAIKYRHGKYDSIDGAYRDFWIYNFEEKNWTHMATLWRKDNQGSQEYAGDVHAFVEDWAQTGENFRSNYLYNARKKYYASTEWKIYDKAYYSINDDETETPTPHDPNTQAEVRDGHKIWLATGGDFNPEDRTSSGTTLHFTPNQNIDKPKSPGLTNVRASNVDDSTFEISWEYDNKKWAAQEHFEIRIYSDEDMNNSVYKTGKLYPHDYDPNPLQPKDRFRTLSHREYEISGLDLEKNKKYYVRLITRSIFGYNSWNSNPVTIKNYTSISEKGARSNLPSEIKLNSNYPNPFNPSTQLSYSLPKSRRISLIVYDLKGNKVSTLIDNQNKSAGRHETTFTANSLSSGIYFYKLKSNNQSLVKKMLLIK